MTKLKVPTTSDGMQELLSDPAKVKEYFSQAAVANGDTKAFLDAYAKQYLANNPDTQDDLRTQVQSVMFDMVRDAGGGRTPNVDLGKLLSFRGGRPELKLSADGTRAISHGKGAVYNKWSPGAQFENSVPATDRFGSIGEYCAAIRADRMGANSTAQQDLIRKLGIVRQFQDSFGSEDPGAGGFLVPEEFRSELMQLALEDTITRRNATVIPMSTLVTHIPMVDDTSHASSLFGGVVFYWEGEGDPITESAATFGSVELQAWKLAGYFTVPNGLLRDAPAFSGWFDQRVPQGLAWKEDSAFMTGTGAKQPKGWVNCASYVQVDRATVNEIAYADIVNMWARLLPTSHKNSVWVANIDTFPQLAQMSLSSPGVWMGGYNVPGIADAPPVSIFGRPVYFTEKVPSLGASGGSVGDISLVDLGYYLIGDRQSVSVAASEHAAFQNDKTAYRIIERVDGRPWLQSALTPANGSNTLSAFVGLSATHP
jgi:HK97 family phage major capsid protein